MCKILCDKFQLIQKKKPSYKQWHLRSVKYDKIKIKLLELSAENLNQT